MITDVYYTIHTKTNSTIYVQYNLADWNNLTRGESASFEFHLPSPGDDLVVSNDRTVAAGTLESYDTVTVQSGATLTVEGILQATQIDSSGTVDSTTGTVNILSTNELEILRQYDDFGGGYATIETLTSETKYRDQLPSDASVTTQAIGIEPSQTLKDRDVTGVWALVDSVDDSRPLALSDETVGVETTVLAEYSEYDNHTELENNLKI